VSFRKKPSLNVATAAWRVPWWRKCKGCGLEFRWERAWAGWWRLGFPGDHPRSCFWHRAFVCRQCEPTAEGATKHFGLFVTQRPPATPAPQHKASRG
jgi:hypothetical protein